VDQMGMTIRNSISRGCIWDPIFQGRRGRRGSFIVLFEREMLFSYRLSIVTIALSVTVQPQFAMKCLRRSIIQQGLGHFGSKF